MDDSTIFIGRKPSINYVLAVITQFNSGAEQVSLKARGRSISKAVDVAEIVRNKYVTDLKVESIQIGTVNLPDEERIEGINVSWIDIVLVKGTVDGTASSGDE
ncbi:MAG: DNA-binding protein Alba [Thermoplasmata archaeon]|nr:DNA-binding protein Alba [Thermoplasmata archaeon]